MQNYMKTNVRITYANEKTSFLKQTNSPQVQMCHTIQYNAWKIESLQ